MKNTLPSTIVVEEKEQSVNKAFDDFMKWHDKYNEFAQGRTNFQIEKFITLEDGTPANSYVNTLYQTRVMRGELIREIKEAVELQRLFEWRWGNHEDKDVPIETKDEHGNDKLLWFDLEKMAYDHRILDMKMSIKDKVQQLDLFDKILEKMEENNGGEFTKEQYDNEAPEYWEKRFERQAVDSIIYARTGIDTGTIKSIRQAVADTIVDGSPNKVGTDSFIADLITGRVDPMQAIEQGNRSTDALYKRTMSPALENKTKAPSITDSRKSTTKKDKYSLDEETVSSLSKLGIGV